MSDFEKRDTTISTSWGGESFTPDTLNEIYDEGYEQISSEDGVGMAVEEKGPYWGDYSFIKADIKEASFADTDIADDSGSAFYLIEEGSTNKILTEDLYQILLGYLRNWKETNVKLSSWVRRNFTGS